MSKPFSLVTALSLLAPAALVAQAPPAASHTTHPKSTASQAPASHQAAAPAAARSDTGGKTLVKHTPNATSKTESLKQRIRSAQEALANRGLYHGKADGRNRRAFRAAVRRFQRENKLPVTGRLTKETLEKLRG